MPSADDKQVAARRQDIAVLVKRTVALAIAFLVLARLISPSYHKTEAVVPTTTTSFALAPVLAIAARYTDTVVQVRINYILVSISPLTMVVLRLIILRRRSMLLWRV